MCKRFKFNPCKFLHTVSENDEKFKELSEKVKKIEDNPNDQLNVEQKIMEIDEKLRVLENLKIQL